MQQHAYREIEASIASIVPYGSVFEIRLLGSNRKRIDAGYFDSPSAAATALSGLDGHYKGIYLTPNPVKPELLARSANRIKPYADTLSMDPDVITRHWLLVDIDPVRPTGISSTDTELESAIDRANQISDSLSLLYGFCEPMLNSSGNGAHLMYPMYEDNSTQVRDVVAAFLKSLSAKFSDHVCVVDTTVFNASRIWRLPGTWARKGDSVSDRPHRKAEILRPIQHLDRVRLDQLQNYIDLNPYTDKPTTPAKPEYPGDERKYKFLNDHAMRRIAEWVPHFFPDAREYKQGFRVASADLGRDLEEDLTIHPLPMGIKDFGTADQDGARGGRRTPIEVVAEFCTGGNKDEAAKRLAEHLNAPITEFTPLPDAMPELPGAQAPKAKFDVRAVTSLASIRSKAFKEPKFIIPGVLPTGNMLLAARPKMRKTWLALQLGIAVCSGSKFLEWDCNKGRVLMLALEDNERRIRSRVDTLLRFDAAAPSLDNFHIWTGGITIDSRGKHVVSNPEEAERTYSTFPRGQAGVDALEHWIEQYPDTSVIIIDTLAHFKEKSNNRDVYERDYEAMMPITRLAARKEVLIVPVTHEKKGLASSDSGDFLEDVTGSAGNTGGSDGVISIKGRRGVQEENESRKLYISGRDVPYDYEVDMTFDAERGGWLPAARQDIRSALRQLFQRHPFINQQELQALLPNISKSRLLRVLTEMNFAGEITRTKFGYQINRGAAA